jgi:hypothetical protein
MFLGVDEGQPGRAREVGTDILIRSDPAESSNAFLDHYAGRLARHNAVQAVIHVAAVQGEPGAGYSSVAQIGRCVTNALLAAESIEVG